MKLFRGKQNLGESTLTLRMWEFTGSALLNLIVFVLVAAYLSPLAYMLISSIKTAEQFGDSQAPLYPATNPQYRYNGEDYPVMEVPTADGIKDWAIVTKRRTYAEFIDPQNPGRGLIHWDGNWYGLKRAYQFNISFQAFTNLLGSRQANIPQATLNTFIIAGVSEIGVLLSSIAVAYGFSRFRIPGMKWLFFLLIATILIPDTITLIPTYITYNKLLNWILTLPIPISVPWRWLPLIAPHFFSSAIFVFLLRQNFKSIPKDLDEAAMLDGAGPMRILVSIIVPQSVPVIATVALLHFFYIWNEVRYASLYLGTRPDLWPISFSMQTASTFTGVPQAGLQASALILMIVPVVVLFVFQRFFMKDMVVTGLEK